MTGLVNDGLFIDLIFSSPQFDAEVASEFERRPKMAVVFFIFASDSGDDVAMRR